MIRKLHTAKQNKKINKKIGPNSEKLIDSLQSLTPAITPSFPVGLNGLWWWLGDRSQRVDADGAAASRADCVLQVNQCSPVWLLAPSCLQRRKCLCSLFTWILVGGQSERTSGKLDQEPQCGWSFLQRRHLQNTMKLFLCGCSPTRTPWKRRGRTNLNISLHSIQTTHCQTLIPPSWAVFEPGMKRTATSFEYENNFLCFARRVELLLAAVISPPLLEREASWGATPLMQNLFLQIRSSSSHHENGKAALLASCAPPPHIPSLSRTPFNHKTAGRRRDVRTRSWCTVVLCEATPLEWHQMLTESRCSCAFELCICAALQMVTCRWSQTALC